MQNTTPNPKNQSKKETPEKPRALGTVASSEDRVRPVVWREKDGNYEIHVTIDRHDCHLLCLFIGVFTLSVLFNSNKRGSSSASA